MPEQTTFTDIDDFLEWYKSKRPETIYLVKNKQRYAEVMNAIKTIYKLAYESNPDGTMIKKPTPDELIGDTLIFDIITNLVAFDSEESQEFCSALSKATTFDIGTMTGYKKVLISMKFADVYDFAPAHNPGLKLVKN